MLNSLFTGRVSGFASRNTWIRVLRSLFVLSLFVVCFVRAGDKPERLKSEEGMKTINGTELYYKIMGKGTPVVILHGGPGLDHTYLLPQMSALAEHFKLIFFDQRASGRSASVVDTNSMTMDNFVEDVEGVRKVFMLGKMNLLGHSWGGLVAMFYAIKYPRNLNSLVLMNSTPASAAMRNASFGVMMKHTTHDDSLAQATLMRTDGFRKGDPKVIADFFRILFRGTFYDRRYADSLTLTIDTSYATKRRFMQYLSEDSSLASYDIHSKLSVVRCPILIVGAVYDLVAPESNEKIHQSIPVSSLVVLDSCGHFPYIESLKKLFNTLDKFLAQGQKR
jgi:proline iminopeptidase